MFDVQLSKKWVQSLYFDELQTKTELEVIEEIEVFLEQINHTCEFCNSKKFKISEVEVNGQALNDFDTNTEG